MSRPLSKLLLPQLLLAPECMDLAVSEDLYLLVCEGTFYAVGVVAKIIFFIFVFIVVIIVVATIVILFGFFGMVVWMLCECCCLLGREVFGLERLEVLLK